MTTTLMILTQNGRGIGTATSERDARRIARQALGCDRVSECAESDGWSYYPAGDTREDGPQVRVTVR